MPVRTSCKGEFSCIGDRMWRAGVGGKYRSVEKRRDSLARSTGPSLGMAMLVSSQLEAPRALSRPAFAMKRRSSWLL